MGRHAGQAGMGDFSFWVFFHLNGLNLRQRIRSGVTDVSALWCGWCVCMSLPAQVGVVSTAITCSLFFFLNSCAAQVCCFQSGISVFRIPLMTSHDSATVLRAAN